MGIRDFFSQILGPGDAELPVHVSPAWNKEDMRRLFTRALAVDTCTNFIASTISICEFQTKKEGEEFRGTEYYRLNVEPNKNICAATFWRKVIEKMVKENHCLVVRIDDEFFIADSFVREERALTPCVYRDVIIGTENPYKLRDVFTEPQVLYFVWNNLEIMSLVTQVYDDIIDLMAAAKTNYTQAAVTKGVFSLEANTSLIQQQQEQLDEFINENARKFLDPKTSRALSLPRGVTYTDLSRGASGTSGNISREMMEFMGDGLDLVARAFQIPPQLLRGEVAGLDDAFRQYMTQCIKPLSDILSDELNRKLFRKKDYIAGNRLFIDTTRIRYVDLKDIAPALEALTRIGANTVDDNLLAIGREAIGGKEGTKRWMTKNYQPLDEYLDSGGQVKEVSGRAKDPPQP